MAYEGMNTAYRFMGCHYISPRWTFIGWVVERHLLEFSCALMVMRRLTLEKTIKLSKQEYQQTLEDLRQKSSNKVTRLI
jgi:hypothetical protein